MMRPLCSNSLVAQGGRLIACRQQGSSKLPSGTSKQAFHASRRRNMAEYPGDMAVHKNKYIEEWNGAREVTEEKFQFTWENAPTVFLSGFGFPFLVYWVTRSDLKQNGDYHFDDLL